MSNTAQTLNPASAVANAQVTTLESTLRQIHTLPLGSTLKKKLLLTFLELLAKEKAGSLSPANQRKLVAIAERGLVEELKSFLQHHKNTMTKQEVNSMLVGITALKRHGVAFDKNSTKSLLGTLLQKFDQMVHDSTASEIIPLFDPLDEFGIAVRKHDMLEKTVLRVAELSATKAAQSMDWHRLMKVLTPVYERSGIELPC